MYRIIHLFPYFKKLYLKSYLFGSKIGNNALIRGGGGLCAERLIRGVTQVSRKRWAYLRRGLYAGGGGLIGGEIRYELSKSRKS